MRTRLILLALGASLLLGGGFAVAGQSGTPSPMGGTPAECGAPLATPTQMGATPLPATMMASPMSSPAATPAACATPVMGTPGA